LAALSVIDRTLKNRPIGSDFGAAKFGKELFELIGHEDEEVRSRARDFVVLAPQWTKIERVSFEEFLQAELGRSDPKIANLADLVSGKPAEFETLKITSEKLRDQNLSEDLQARFFELGLSLIIRMARKNGVPEQYDDLIGVLLDLEKKFQVQKAALLGAKDDQDAFDRVQESRKIVQLIDHDLKPTYIISDVSEEELIRNFKFKAEFSIGSGMSFNEMQFLSAGPEPSTFILKSSGEKTKDVTLVPIRKLIWSGSASDGRRVILLIRDRAPGAVTSRYDLQFFVITDSTPSVLKG
jgi:hypothetical protein